MIPPNTCPFCGAAVIQVVDSIPPAIKGRQVQCNDCGARGPIYDRDEESIKGWDDGIFITGKGGYRKSD